MKELFTTLICTMFSLLALAQTGACDNQLDSVRVVQIAKLHNAWWTVNWQSPPTMTFNKEACEWTVISWKAKHTKRGDCKHTNGCTLSKQVTLVIDATDEMVKSRIVEKSMFPNYE